MNANFPLQNPVSDPSDFASVTLSKGYGLGTGFCLGETMKEILSCLRGEHVPVAVIDKHHRVIEVCCQGCFVPMTKDQHKNYFENTKSQRGDYLDFAVLNYDEPGDPSDVG